MRSAATCHPDRFVEARGLCLACYTALMRGRLDRRTRRQRGEDLMSWVTRNISEADHNGCRNWLRALTHKGYGVVAIHHRQLSHVSRVVWAHYNGPIPAGMHVCHRCDNRRCCELSHLFLGTNADNVRDCNEKGRRPRGERHWGSALTGDIVRSIRTAKASGETQASIAARLGVHQSTISDVLTGRCWSHVT